ncbi:phosphoribosylformylglycinamidine cyclo-ligase [Thermoactinomyces sp. DSM 45892]|uniref:phosphoribosylformylglycinamidine cyclo-ligase n=1 Tax=Thermoactinomyces sp. DSM 45892 TaxID=1882753 RepID=UPI00089A00D1|nr:phosphoribosylformylglycinamidine cyclo-ligase [Thermoactinomyces sp. DSM 45892]SDZ26211.1 phosphoribosylformylglycinamidine cyclo-ligase [Thermoactinomyces sp. DSM 45892]
MSKSYRAAGVDIDAGNEAVERMKSHVSRTTRPEVMGGLGGFGGLFALGSYDEPVLVSATDGIGTKLKVAFMLDRHDTIGIDCVAMCVNDLVVQGAEPLFFLDYLATGKLLPEQAEAVVKGIADGCVQAGCALIGGETAEMPGMYASGEYDVAGFCVGVVEKRNLLPSYEIQAGDLLIGLASNGLHSNGYSLARKVLLTDRVFDWSERVPGSSQNVAEVMLTPTRIYVKSVLSLVEHFTIKGAAHITGGGIVENVPRMLPEGLQAVIDRNSWQVPPIFQWIQQVGSISQSDMDRTFNNGIGMVLCVPIKEADSVMKKAVELGETPFLIGRVEEGMDLLRFDDGGCR